MTASLAVAMEAAVAVAIAVAPITRPVGNAEHAVNGAHRAADAGTNGTADHAAHRTSDPVTLVRTLLCTAHDALCMDRKGKPEKRVAVLSPILFILIP